MSLGEAVELALAGTPLPRNPIIFTMDDGYWDQGEIGAQIFLEFDVPATLFLITGVQDGTTWAWDNRLDYIFEHTRRDELRIDLPGGPVHGRLADAKQRQVTRRSVREALKQVPFRELERYVSAVAMAAGIELPEQPPAVHRPLGWAAARSLEAKGLQFAPHSVSHGIVARMNDDGARRELLGAWTRLQAELHSPVRVYGWPTGRCGDFTSRDIAIVRDAGFLGAVATDDDYADFRHTGDMESMYRLRRFSMPDSITRFLMYGSGAERLKQVLRMGRR